MRRRIWAIPLAVIVALVWGVGRFLAGQARRRRSSIAEGVEGEESAEGDQRISTFPQMHFLYCVVAKRALRKARKGKALDIRCRSARLIIEMAKRAPQMEFVGLDRSEDMLDEASENVAEARLSDRVSFKEGDATALPFPDASFDLVVTSLSMHHWSEPKKVLNEIARVLRPEGRFLIFDLRRDAGPPAWFLFWFVNRFAVRPPLKEVGEPLGSLKAAYTRDEAARLATLSCLPDWRISTGLFWLFIESAD